MLSQSSYFQVEGLWWPVVEQLGVLGKVDNAQVTPTLSKVRLCQACTVCKGRVEVVNGPPGRVQKVLQRSCNVTVGFHTAVDLTAFRRNRARLSDSLPCKNVKTTGVG